MPNQTRKFWIGKGAIILILILIGGAYWYFAETPCSSKVLYMGSAIKVVCLGTEVIIENITDTSISIRISWDEQDPNGIGYCPAFPEDCFIDDAVEPGSRISGLIKNHSSVQVWVWGQNDQLIDTTNQSLTLE